MYGVLQGGRLDRELGPLRIGFGAVWMRRDDVL